MKKNAIITRLFVFALVLIVANMISSKMYFRWDFTEDQRYTLSKATDDVLTDLDDVITVKAYFSEDLPTQLISNKQDFEDLLIEYENESDGNVVYEFISPNETPELEQQAQQNGIQPLIVNVSEKDQMQQIKAYMGAVLMMGDRKEIIPVVQPGVNMEYDLTTAIKKLSVTDKPKIALLQGNGEPSMKELAQLSKQLSVLYDVQTLDLVEQTEVPKEVKTLAIIQPKDTIPAEVFTKIDAFLRRGGAVFVAYANMKGDLQTGSLTKADDVGIEGWLREKKLQMGSELVTDAESGFVSVQQNNGLFTFQSQVQFHYFPRISKFPEQPVTSGLEAIMLPFVSRLTYTGASDTAVNYTPLLLTSELSGLVPTPTQVDINKQWTKSDFAQGPQTLSAVLEGPLAGAGSQPSKLLVVTNGQFIISGDSPQQISPDNVNFASNAIDWLSDDTGLIELRTKAITNRPLEKLDDTKRELLKYGNVLVPVLLVFIYAFMRKQRYMRKKQRWMQGNF